MGGGRKGVGKRSLEALSFLTCTSSPPRLILGTSLVVLCFTCLYCVFHSLLLTLPTCFLSSQITSYTPLDTLLNPFCCLTDLNSLWPVSLSFCFLCVLKPYCISCHPPSLPPSFFSSPGRSPSVHLSPLVSVCLSISGPPVPCTCHRAQPFDKSREGQTEFCRTRQSLNIWLPCPQVLCCVLYQVPGSPYI